MSYDREKLKQELLHDEGKRTQAYQDTLGNWTIGVGHLLNKQEIKEYVPSNPKLGYKFLSEGDCAAFLERDIEDAEHILDHIFPEFWRELDDVRQRALLNLAFNLGNRLWHFMAFIRFVEDKNWKEAGRQLPPSKWWKQVKTRGPRIKNMIETGEV